MQNKTKHDDVTHVLCHQSVEQKKKDHKPIGGRSRRQHSDSFQLYISMPFTNQVQNKEYFLHLGRVLDYTQRKSFCTKREMLKNCVVSFTHDLGPPRPATVQH